MNPRRSHPSPFASPLGPESLLARLAARSAADPGAGLGIRREFLRASLLASLSAVALPSVLRADPCELTTADILGPYWVPDAPWRSVLASPDEPGTRLFIEGRISASDCATGLEGTIVDVWQASDAGCYSVVQDCPDEDPFNLRGQMLTGASGVYAFESVLPGYYPGRCRHVHFRIVPASGPRLVTQLYFQGDPRIPDDPYASNPDAVNRIIPLVEDGNGALHGVFDVNLWTSATETEDPEDQFPTRTRLYPAYPNPLRSQAVIRYQTAAAAEVELSVFDAAGRRIRRLERESREPGYHTVIWDGKDDRGVEVASGVYTVRLSAPPIVRSEHLVVAR
jgi:protocatechuate 3,4-dioxygenase beta subunit